MNVYSKYNKICEFLVRNFGAEQFGENERFFLEQKSCLKRGEIVLGMFLIENIHVLDMFSEEEISENHQHMILIGENKIYDIYDKLNTGKIFAVIIHHTNANNLHLRFVGNCLKLYKIIKKYVRELDE